MCWPMDRQQFAAIRLLAPPPTPAVTTTSSAIRRLPDLSVYNSRHPDRQNGELDRYRLRERLMSQADWHIFDNGSNVRATSIATRLRCIATTLERQHLQPLHSCGGLIANDALKIRNAADDAQTVGTLSPPTWVWQRWLVRRSPATLASLQAGKRPLRRQTPTPGRTSARRYGQCSTGGTRVPSTPTASRFGP